MSLQKYFQFTQKRDIDDEYQNVELIIETKNRIRGTTENDYFRIRNAPNENYPFESELHIFFKDFFHLNQSVDKDTLGEEISALMSLFFRKTFTYVGISRIDDLPINPYKRRKRLVHPALIKGYKSTFSNRTLVDIGGDLKDFKEFFDDLISSTQDEKFLLYIQAVKRYNNSLQLIEDEPELSFLNLVSSIEILSNDYKINISFDDLDESWQKIGKLLDENITDIKIRKEIKTKIVKKQYFVGRRFKEFIKAYLPDDFWDNSDASIEFLKARKIDFDKYLNEIYNQRSKTLHKGMPLPSSCWYMTDDADIPFAVQLEEMGKPISKRRGRELNNLPTLIFIERMVNFILMNYFRKEISNR